MLRRKTQELIFDALSAVKISMMFLGLWRRVDSWSSPTEMVTQFYSTARFYYTCQNKCEWALLWQKSLLYTSSESWCHAEMVVECLRSSIPLQNLPRQLPVCGQLVGTNVSEKHAVSIFRVFYGDSRNSEEHWLFLQRKLYSDTTNHRLGTDVLI